MWDLIVSVPDHCLSFYFVLESFSRKQQQMSSAVSKITPLFNQKPSVNGFKLSWKFYLSQIISL